MARVQYGFTRKIGNPEKQGTWVKYRVDCDLCGRSSLRLEAGESYPLGWIAEGTDTHFCPECAESRPDHIEDIEHWDLSKLRAEYGCRQALRQRMQGERDRTELLDEERLIVETCMKRFGKRLDVEVTITNSPRPEGT